MITIITDNKTNDDGNEDDTGNSKILITEVHYIYFTNKKLLLIS